MKIDDIYICNDNPIPVPEHIKKMTDEEIEIEFKKRFWKYVEHESKIIDKANGKINNRK